MFQNIKKLRKAYKNNVEDIDLFVGMIMEDATDGPIGDTFRCLIVDVFSRMRYGDRYFYDNAGQAGSFTPSKLFLLINRLIQIRNIFFLFLQINCNKFGKCLWQEYYVTIQTSKKFNLWPFEKWMDLIH